MQNEINLSVIIVNFNGIAIIEECLDSLKRQTYRNFNISVIDNNSKDYSKELIKDKYKDIKIVELNENTGFCKANNLGINLAIKQDNIKYIVLLNNDTVCDKNFLENMIEAVNFDDKTGMAAAKMLFYTKKDTINNAGGFIRPNGCFDGIGFGEKDSDKFNLIKEVFAPSGAAAIYKKELLTDIKYKDEYFDESFFAYHEDIDLAFRARLLGWKCYYTPKGIVLHHHSKTFKNSKNKDYLCFRNNILSLCKCLPVNIVLEKGFFMTSYFALKAFKNLLSFNLTFLSAIVRSFFHFTNIMAKRASIQRRIRINEVEIKRILNL